MAEHTLEIILASQSPRRKELLNHMGVVFDVVPSKFEEHLDSARDPSEVAEELALGKALDVARDYPGSVVIGSDTIVTVDGEQLGKARDAEEAHEMLRKLSGKSNYVTTGLAVVRLSDDTRLIGSATTEVRFKTYDGDAVADYIATGDFLDKAGAYGIQSGAATLIEYIKGDYDTVVGLSTRPLAEFLGSLGIIAQPVILKPPVRQMSAE